MDSPNLALIKRYFQAIEADAPEDVLRTFFAPTVVQEEFPNRLVTNGARRDLAAILEGSRRGRAVVRGQRYEILHVVETGPHVALEVQWSASLQIPLGSLAAGETMRARFGVFIDVRDGVIVAQRNYDCFDAF